MAIENTTPSHFTAVNDITGNLIKSRPASEAYKNNYDAIFRKEVATEDDATKSEQHSS